MRTKRIIVGILIGAIIGAGLEYINGFLTFLMPPFFILLPLAALIGGCIGAVVKGTKDDRLLGKTQDIEHLPAYAAEFLRLVIRKMRYRSSVQKDVQAELAAHFEDELKDCASDQEKEQKAEQLIAEFGDVKLLAVLLRRAKKRCRPLWRTVVARTFQAVGIIIVCFILYVVWFFSGKPVVTVNYVAELNKIVRPAADESLNAGPLYLKSIDLYKELSDDFLLFFAKNHKAVIDEKNQHQVQELAKRINELLPSRKHWNFQKERQDTQGEVSWVLYQFLRGKYNEFTIEQKHIAERWLQEHNDALELIIEGSRKPYYWRTYESGGEKPDEMIGVRLPYLADFRGLVYSLRWRARLSAGQGRYKDAFEDIKSCYRLGRHLRGDKFLIEQLVGIAVEAIAVQTFRDILSQYQIDSATLVALQKDFEQIIASENFVISLKLEKMMLYDAIQRCFTTDRIGHGHLYLPRIEQLRQFVSQQVDSLEHFTTILHALFTHPNKYQSREMADRYYAFFEKMARKTPAQIHTEGIDIEQQAMEIIKGNLLLEIFAPALGRINEISHRNKTEVQATLTTLAILRYKQTIGAYPNSLEELLTAGYIKEIPIDSYSDKPLVYKKKGDDFILYSVGPNCVDDGGQSGKDGKGKPKLWVDNGDAVFWPVPETE